MRELVISEVESAQALMQCPVGSRVRLLAISTSWAGLSASDQLILSFQRGASTMIEVASNPVGAGTLFIDGIKGGEFTEQAANKTDPVTGIITYDTLQNAVFPLPDIWWDFEVNLLVDTVLGSGTIGASRIVYERESHEERKNQREKKKGRVGHAMSNP